MALAGVALAALSGLADTLGFGEEGFGDKQMAGLIAGGVIALIGFVMMIWKKPRP